MKPRRKLQAKHPGAVLIIEMPLEILEMIFGGLNFADLPNLLLACKWINTAFKGTKYGTQLKLVAKYDYDSLHSAYRQMKRNSRTEWQVKDVLEAFTGAYCECGKVAWIVNWLNVPPVRLCHNCFRDKKYSCALLANTLDKFKLTKRDVKTIPTMKAGDQLLEYDDFHPNSILIQTSVVEDIARRKRRDICEYRRLYPSAVACLQFLMYDYRKQTAYAPLGCYLCKPTDDPFFARKFNCPHNYESLREHIVDVHPEILESFETGWNALGTDMQQRWQASGNKYDLAWRSWPHAAFKQIQYEFAQQRRIPPSYENLLEFAYDEIIDLIPSKLSHSGLLFDLPNIPGMQDICDDVYRLAAEIIIRKEVDELIERLKKKTERDGVAGWREYLSEYSLEGMESTQ